MRIPSVVATLSISVAMFVCVQPARGQDILARLDNLEAQVATLQSALDDEKAARARQVTELQTALFDERAARQNIDQIIADVIIQMLDGLKHFSRDGDDIYITGANLHIVNGTGETETKNGLGNLIVGYNEGRTGIIPNLPPDDRTGSHMLVVGKENNYSSYGGIVVGVHNTTSLNYSRRHRHRDDSGRSAPSSAAVVG